MSELQDRNELEMLENYSHLYFDLHFVMRARPLHGEWQPPSEVPQPANPVEAPEFEPEEPTPGPREIPVEPDETPPAKPPEVRLVSL